MEKEKAIETMMEYAEDLIRGYIKLRWDEGAETEITEKNVRFHMKLAMCLENDTWRIKLD